MVAMLLYIFSMNALYLLLLLQSKEVSSALNVNAESKIGLSESLYPSLNQDAFIGIDIVESKTGSWRENRHFDENSVFNTEDITAPLSEESDPTKLTDISERMVGSPSLKGTVDMDLSKLIHSILAEKSDDEMGAEIYEKDILQNSGWQSSIEQTRFDDDALFDMWRHQAKQVEDDMIQDSLTSASSVGTPSFPPSSVPTPLPDATSYILEYVYDSNGCSGVPYSVTSYSLGICFPYTGQYGYVYGVYLGYIPSGQTYIELTFTQFSDSVCTKAIGTTYDSLLPTTCSDQDQVYALVQQIPSSLPAAVVSSYYPSSSTCGVPSAAIVTVYQTLGHCNPYYNIYTCPGGPDYNVATYSTSDCSGEPYSTTSSSLAYCAIQPNTDVPTYYNFFSDDIFVSVECIGGPTAPPTIAPTIPTNRPSSQPSNPTVAPTLAPSSLSPTAFASGFVSQNVYLSSTCSGVPNTVTVYQLGVCFYFGSADYGVYTLAAASTSESITLVYTQFSNSGTECAGAPSFSHSTELATSCSNGNNFVYSTSFPVVPQALATSYYSYDEECSTSTSYLTFYQSVGNCNPSTNQIVTCSAAGAGKYYTEYFTGTGCTGSYTSTGNSTTPPGKCAYNSGKLPLNTLGGVNNGNAIYYYSSIQCTSGFTAAPTPGAPTLTPTAGAPSNPTFQPTASPLAPTSKPSSPPTPSSTPFSQATGFVSLHRYASSTCTGALNSVTVYSLGICSSIDLDTDDNSYDNYATYIQYALGGQSSGCLTLVATIYIDDLCTIASERPIQSYQLSTACSAGFNYTFSDSLPSLPESVATSYYSYLNPSDCARGAAVSLVTVYNTVGSCNPATNQIYACTGSSYSISTFSTAGCSGTSTEYSFTSTACAYNPNYVNIPTFLPQTSRAFITTQCTNQLASTSSSSSAGSSSSSSGSDAALGLAATAFVFVVLLGALVAIVLVCMYQHKAKIQTALDLPDQRTASAAGAAGSPLHGVDGVELTESENPGNGKV